MITTVAPNATMTVSHLGRPSGIYSMMPVRVSAANKAITPWAKLKTPDALKISTKPRATSE